jgi:arginyl-tRNA synthetase
MILRDEIQSLVEEALENAIKEGKLPAGDYPKIKIEYPKEEKFGDYATPVAMEAAKIVRKNPVETGEILREYIAKSNIIERVDVVKPGFINIFISKDHLVENLGKARTEDARYGIRTKKSPGKINIEFVSANPTGPLNVVSARAAAIGDTLANLLEANGDLVDREYYINDFGNQVTLFGRSTYARYLQNNGIDAAFPEDGYHGEYVKDIARMVGEKFSAEIAALNNNESELVDFFARKSVDYIVSLQQEDMKLFKVEYKRWFKESSLHDAGSVMKTLEDLQSKGVIYDEEGKKIFRSTDYGDDKDRVVVRNDGRPTYLLADIAYHKNKFERGYDQVIDIWGPDHHGYIARIRGAIQALGYEGSRFRVLIAQQVNLLSGGELVKMSKRLGIFSTMRDLLEEIGSDVARYFFIMRSLESHLDFDLELAKKQSSENPVFYLQYAHARICSVFTEAAKVGLKPADSLSISPWFENDESISLIRLIAKFPDEIADAADALEPHRIANFLLRLAQGYHKFYFEHRIITDDKERSSAYLALCDAVRLTLRNGLGILGVSAPERM